MKKCVSKYLPKHTIDEQDAIISFDSTTEFTYGTSGFRDKAETNPCDLWNAMNKSAIFIGLLFLKHNFEVIKKNNLLKGPLWNKHTVNSNRNTEKIEPIKYTNVKFKNVGIIITASHNPADDNGVKILDSEGEQIKESYENSLMQLVNCHLRYLKESPTGTVISKNMILDIIIECIVYYFKEEVHINLWNNEEYEQIKIADEFIYNWNISHITKSNICIGFDTRDSAVLLNNIINETLHCLNIKKCINNMCYTTTPCMHFIIYYMNNFFNSDKIDKDILQREKWITHKKLNDLEYIHSFRLNNTDSVFNLYYNKKIIQEKRNHCINNNEYVDISPKIPSFNLEAYNNDDCYFNYMSALFFRIYDQINDTFDNLLINNTNKVETIYVDCSNGIAALKIQKFGDLLKLLNKNMVTFNCIKEESNILNYICGAEYIHRVKKAPLNTPIDKENNKYCSFDGDADRILYFFFEDTQTLNNKINETNDKKEKTEINQERQQIVVLDGTKIIVLLLKAIIHILSFIKLNSMEYKKKEEDIEKLNINIIQTAYANNAYIQYVKKLKEEATKKYEIFKYININLLFTKTGVKHLERVARNASIGIFFEPNGHGTIYTNRKELVNWSTCLNIQKNVFFITLQKYLYLFSQSTGDAMINFIAIELTLSLLNLTIQEWNNFYNCYSSSYINVKCSKATLPNFKPHPEHEMFLIHPETLQTEIDRIVFEIDKENGRCFIRPSGTEPLVRIYAEAQDEHKKNKILQKVEMVLIEYINSLT